MAWKPTRDEIYEMVVKYRQLFGHGLPCGGAMPLEDQLRFWEIIRECLETRVPYDESKYTDPGPEGTTADGWC